METTKQEDIKIYGTRYLVDCNKVIHSCDDVYNLVHTTRLHYAQTPFQSRKGGVNVYSVLVVVKHTVFIRSRKSASMHSFFIYL